MRTIGAIFYGLFTIWTGLLRGIEAHAYKPNALWFCLVMGSLAIAAGYLFRLGRNLAGLALGLFATLVVLGFYLYSFITAPAEDATVRVGLIIVASIGHLAVLTLPPAGRDGTVSGSM